jgi:predicted SprT family Zn-dependent metalloprotease
MNFQMSRSGSALQLELFKPEAPAASSQEHNLEALFAHLNDLHWRGKLPEFKCEWSNRMITTWGACYKRRKLIRISSIFKQRPQDEILALLSHEMIHILYGGHGKRFRQELKRIGLEGDIQRRFPQLVEWTHSLRRAYKYTYRCQKCCVQIQRRRKIHGYCVACHEKGIRSKFKLYRTRTSHQNP